MKTARIQNWYSTSAVITLIPEIAIDPRKVINRDVWQKQLIVLARRDIEALDAPDAALDRPI